MKLTNLELILYFTTYMDDIQFWLYLAFAAIYFITRMMKKKNAPEPTQSAEEKSEHPERRTRPVSFEDLLKEFTEGKQESEPEAPRPVEARQLVKEREWVAQQKPKEFEEGRTRRFADEESRRVYEESIRLAEGSDLEFKRDEHFKSKMQRQQDEGDQQSLGADIKSMLQDADSAKKAVILSEILNRKY